MGSIFHDIYDFLKNNEKEMLIQKSGSTMESSNEKIRSGQSYLYKKYGMESEVIEVRFKQKVSGSFLNQALLQTCRRYPYINTKLIEKNGDFYIVQNEQSMIARRTKQLVRLGHISCGYHLVDITYYDDSIFVSFHHALCDGRGIMPFIETLIYYYCNLKYGSKKPPEGVRLAEDPLLPGETVDPFLQEYDFDQNKKFIELSRDAYAIPENVPSEEITNYRYEVKIPAEQYMKLCKKNNATPVILLSLLMSRAITELYPDYDKPVNANIATDMREALDCPNTFKNCVKSMILPYSREFSKKTLTEQATEYREILKAQRDRDFCRKEANAMLGLFDKLDSFNSYEEKQKMMAFFEGMTLNTYIISYLGQFKLGENAQYIDEIHLYNSGTTGLGINMISCGEYFVLDFKQNFASDKYVKAFTAQIDKLGVVYHISAVIPFITPGDSVIKRS
ncbi:MAG TPA: hypothetical protein IAC39_03995 [Candidatus Faeciplasma pullistercoris]|uniref:Condensation domain-containing protein n=1 Tax=Candidatus Faeciplasma pullistercoris TaxID=2840800 RepID=A0A9D1GTC7_9FIRM|nr:hypothetical protein [Candidatus Faeciplasma pullistercoris]